MSIKAEKQKPVAGVVLIATAIVFAVISVIMSVVGSGKIAMPWEDVIFAAGLAVLGVIMIHRNVKGYGWLIASFVLMIAAVTAFLDTDMLRFIACLLFFIVFMGMVINKNRRVK